MYLIEINKHVIISLHDKLCLVTILRDPEVAHDRLEGEVVVCVQEVPLDNVLMLLVLLLYFLLLPFILRVPQ